MEYLEYKIVFFQTIVASEKIRFERFQGYDLENNLYFGLLNFQPFGGIGLQYLRFVRNFDCAQIEQA